MVTWNPTTYLQFADERSRPFTDLVARIAVERPRRVVDLGCGPGQMTASLAERWASAEIVGLDSSPEMIEQARSYAGERVCFELGDLRTWRPEGAVDVLLSNATLQWVPGHRDLLSDWVERLSPGGWFARPVLQALPDDLRAAFVREYQALLRDAYPQRSFGTVLPFRRIFVVARRR